MVTKGADPDATFLDTNILVNAALPTAPFHGAAIARLGEIALVGGSFWVSRQIFREYLATLSRPQPFTPPLAIATLLGDIAKFQTQFQVAEDGPVVTANLLNLLATIPCGGKQVHDANIVATMQARGITRLLTHNVADFARFSGLIAILTI